MHRTVLVFSLVVLASSAKAQLRPLVPPDSVSPRAAAESLTVFMAQREKASRAPLDAALHFHVGLLAHQLAQGAWVARLPREYTRNKAVNASGQLVELLNVAVDELGIAVDLQPE